jgi:hypothetical protein
MNAPFKSIEEIDRLVAAFERAELPRRAWDHRAHLAVAAWYLLHDHAVVARNRFVRGIKRYNTANGIVQTHTGGYHETLTMFWCCAVEVVLEECTALEIVSRVNEVIARFSNDKTLVFAYYTRDELFNAVARRSWVPPQRYPGGQLTQLSEALARFTNSVSRVNISMSLRCVG